MWKEYAALEEKETMEVERREYSTRGESVACGKYLVRVSPNADDKEEDARFVCLEDMDWAKDKPWFCSRAAADAAARNEKHEEIVLKELMPRCRVVVQDSRLTLVHWLDPTTRNTKHLIAVATPRDIDLLMRVMDAVKTDNGRGHGHGGK
jgi:hypothetical protein